MKTFAAAILVAVLAQSSALQQTKATEQPCTPASLVGTWQLLQSGGEAKAGGGSTLKHVTPTHFFVVAADAAGLASYGHGGPYTLNESTYTESITHGFGQPFDQIRGMSVSFKCSMDADVWHSVGELGGMAFDERWKRVPPAAKK
jgi:hypothetical protein